MNLRCYFGRHAWRFLSAHLPATNGVRIAEQCDRCGLRRGRIEAAR